MRMQVLPHLFLILVFTTCAVTLDRFCVPDKPSKPDDNGVFHSCRIPGDFLIGALFPLTRFQDQGGKDLDYAACSNELSAISVIQSEAMMMYLNQVSTHLQEKHGFTMGLTAIDDCSSSALAFQRSVTNFIEPDSTKCKFCTFNESRDFSKDVSFVLSGIKSEATLYANQLLQTYCIPLLSVSATASQLSNEKRHPFFLRIVPSDSNQAQALIDMIIEFQWNHIAIVYENLFYSESFKQDFLSALKNHQANVEDAKKNVSLYGNFCRKKWTACVEWITEIDVLRSDTDWTTLDSNLANRKTPKVIIAIMQVRSAEDLMDHIESSVPNQTDIQFISVDGWTSLIEQPCHVLNHAIGTEPRTSEIPIEFVSHLHKISLKTALSPWTVRLIEQDHSCCWPCVQNDFCVFSKVKNCTGEEKLDAVYASHTALRFSERNRIALQILNNTLSTIHQSMCGSEKRMCSNMTASLNGTLLRNQLLDLNKQFFYDGTNSGYPSYTYFQYQKENESWADVGVHNGSHMMIHTTKVQAVMESKWEMLEERIHKCFPDCPTGYADHAGWSGSCCWVCVNCTTDNNRYGFVKIHESNIAICETCEAPMTPTLDYRGCNVKDLLHISFDEYDGVVFALASIGCISCLLVFLALKLKSKTPIILEFGSKVAWGNATAALCMLLSSILMLGVSWSSKPTYCNLPWVPFTVSVTGNLAVFLMKARSLHRQLIQQVDCRTTCTWIHSNVFLFACMISFQLVLCIIWLVTGTDEPIYIQSTFPDTGQATYLAVCSGFLSPQLFLISLIPLILLVFLSVFLILIHRHVRTHFQLLQQKYMLITAVGLFVILLLVMVLSIRMSEFKTEKHGKYAVKIFTTCMTGFALLSLVPLSRILMLVFQVKKNTKTYVEKELLTIMEVCDKIRLKEEDIIILDEPPLGSGHFAEVLHGKLRKCNPGGSVSLTDVAIKRLKPQADSRLEIQKFYEEAIVMAHLEHENIVRLIGTCETQNCQLLAMEYVNGGSLKTFLQKKVSSQVNDLAIFDLVGFCKDVCKACCFLEKKHFIHRDIKAENCLIQIDTSTMSKKYTVKLSDFGLAKDIHHGHPFRCNTLFLAPVRHTAPEGFSNKFTNKSDVWSFGVLIWEILHFGATPLPNVEDRELYAVVHGRRKTVLDFPVPEVLPVPTKAWSSMRLCLAYEPDCRPTFHELQKHIEDILPQQRNGETYIRLPEQHSISQFAQAEAPALEEFYHSSNYELNEISLPKHSSSNDAACNGKLIRDTRAVLEPAYNGVQNNQER